MTDYWSGVEPLVTARSGVSHASLAATLGISEQSVAVPIHRLRQRLRNLVRTEVARTVLTSADLDSDLAYLLGLFKRR